MSLKDVKEYYMRMTSDYLDLKETLDRLESEVTEDTAPIVLENIQRLKENAEKVQENYNRLNYIMYLFDLPNRKEKKARWVNQNKKRLKEIPEKDRMAFVQGENKTNIDELKKYIKC